MAFIEKCRSKCHKINWDSESGHYGEDCPKGGKCDTNGEKRVDGVATRN
jgi:hypothetical protein